MILFLFFIIAFINIKNTKSYLKFPLEYLPNENYNFFKESKYNPEKIFQQIYYKNLITKIKIGTNQKTQIFFIETNKNKFYISSQNPRKIFDGPEKNINFYNIPEKELYNEELSSTYKENNCKKTLQNIDHFIELCYGWEKIYFKKEDKTLAYNFPVKLAKNHEENIPGVIGLLLNDTSFNNSRSLITELKKENLIDSYYWFIDIEEISPLDKYIKGNLIIGGLPHEIYPEKYLAKDYKTQNAIIVPYIFESWRIKLNKVYIEGNSKELEKNIITFSYEFYHIIGTLEFHNLIKTSFLDKLIKDKKCHYSKFSQNIYTNYNMTFYYCDKSVKNILYEKIPAIKFFSLDLSYIFEMTKEELFYIKDDYIYFNILFSEKEFNFWIMGQIFTTKYNFFFNTNNKQIGFYQKNNYLKSDNINNINNDKRNNYLIIIIIIISIIFTCLGIILGIKLFRFRKKIIVKELIEENNNDYKSYNTNDISNDIEDNYKSNYNSIVNKKNGIFEMINKFD